MNCNLYFKLAIFTIFYSYTDGLILENIGLRFTQNLTISRIGNTQEILVISFEYEWLQQRKSTSVLFSLLDNERCGVSPDVTVEGEQNEINNLSRNCSSYATLSGESVITIIQRRVRCNKQPEYYVKGVLTLENRTFGIIKQLTETTARLQEFSATNAIHSCFMVKNNTSDMRPRYRFLFPSEDLWDNCYPGSESSHTLLIGVAIGPNLQAMLQTTENILNYIEEIFGRINMIFSKQLNINFLVTHVRLSSLRKCSESTVHHLKLFAEETATFNTRALWHLLESCPNKSEDAAGAAVAGGLCSDYGNVGLSIVSDNWQSFLITAHELGHNLGASHSFEDGKGKTGGIMDYGNYLYENDFKFNTKYRQDEICSFLTNIILSEKCSSKGLKLLRLLEVETNKCGNGKLETELGEECECPSGRTCQCCRDCKLSTFAECDPYTNECCDNNCMFKKTTQKNLCSYSSITLQSKLGYCSNGKCVDDFCSAFNLDFCGIQEENNCKQRCKRKSGSSTICPTTDWIVSGKSSYVREGSACTTRDGFDGLCKEGECLQGIPTSFPTHIEKNPIVPTPLIFPGSQQESKDKLVLVIMILCILSCTFIIVLLLWQVLMKRDKNYYWLKKSQGRTHIGLVNRIREFRNIYTIKFKTSRRLTDTGVEILKTPHKLPYIPSNRKENKIGVETQKSPRNQVFCKRSSSIIHASIHSNWAGINEDI